MKPHIALLVASLWATGATAAPLEMVGQDQVTLAFTLIDIRRAIITPDPAGEPAIAITLDGDAALRLGMFTTKRAGQPISILICSSEVAQPVVIEPIMGGIVMLTGLPQDDLPRILSILNREVACGNGGG